MSIHNIPNKGITSILATFGLFTVATTLAVTMAKFTGHHNRVHNEAKNHDIADYASEILAMNSFYRSQCDPMALPGSIPVSPIESLVPLPGQFTNSLSSKFTYTQGENSYCGEAKKNGSSKKREICFRGERPPKLGALDNSYGNEGVASFTFPNSKYSAATDVIVQPVDGKIVALGIVDYPNYATAYTTGTVVRFNANGTLDLGFADNGVFMPPAAHTWGDEVYYSVSLQDDGKIVVLGLFDSWTKFQLIRLTADGVPDSTFGDGGWQILDPSAITPGVIVPAGAEVIFHNNKLIVLGSHIQSVSGSYENHMIAMRLNTNGSFDTSFGNGGVTLLGDLPHSSYSVAAATVQSDGSIIGLWDSARRDSTSEPWIWEAALTKIGPNGLVDPSFGDEGIVNLFPLPPQFASMTFASKSLAIQPDGKFLIGADLKIPNVRYLLAVLRRNADGSPDTSFGGGGISDTSFTCSIQAEARGLMLRSDGKIDLLGVITRPVPNSSPVYDVAIARLHAIGGLDNTFGNGNGQEIIRLESPIDLVQAVLQTDGKVVVVGDQTDYEAEFTLYTVRFIP